MHYYVMCTLYFYWTLSQWVTVGGSYFVPLKQFFSYISWGEQGMFL